MKKLRNHPLVTFVESAIIAVGACSLVLLVTVISVRTRPVQDGVGGFDSPGIPLVTEERLDETVEQPIANGGYELSYTSYRVRPGDIIGHIASSNGVTQDTIISVNNVRNSRTIQIGSYLKIPSMPGILYTVKQDSETIESVAKKYEVDAEKCASVNHKELGAALTAGTTLFVPDAELDWVTRQEINGDLFRKPIRARWYLSSKFGWRANPFTGARTYHSGVDMACPQGTFIYAALPGKVTATGYNNTYGNYVIVTHHSGYKTLYGHMSAILAVQGQSVSTDTKIGKVGSTGMSTGPHLHFTVYKNGKQVNPLNLWN